MKKWRGLLLALVMLLTLAACGADGENGGIAGAEEPPPFDPEVMVGDWSLSMVMPEGGEAQSYHIRLEGDGTMLLLAEDGGTLGQYAYEVGEERLSFSDSEGKVCFSGRYTSGDAGELTFYVEEYDDGGSGTLLPAAPVYQGELYAAMRDGKYGFVDEKDQTVIPFVYDQVGRFSDGLCPVYDASQKGWGYINTAGEQVIDCLYAEAGSFTDGLAPVEVLSGGGRWGYINTRGETVIEPAYQACGACSDGLLPAKLNGYWGFLRPDGSTAIEFLYQEMADQGFCYGRAVVAINKAWGVIDTSGNYLVPLNRQTGTLYYNSPNFFQLGTSVYNGQGRLLRSDREIWYADGERCLVFDGEGAAEIIDTAGNTVVDLCQLAADTLPAVNGEISAHLIAFRDRNWKQDMTSREIDGDLVQQWEGWLLVMAQDAGLAQFESSRCQYLNLINLQGELFWDQWLLKNYQRESQDRATVEMWGGYAVVSDREKGQIEAWNLDTGTACQLEGAMLLNAEHWKFSNVTPWGDCFITQTRSDENGNSFQNIYSLETLSDPYPVYAAREINDRYLLVCEPNGIFWGVLTREDGQWRQVFPLEYTAAEYVGYGDEAGYLYLEKGARQSRYWLGPNGNFLPA